MLSDYIARIVNKELNFKLYISSVRKKVMLNCNLRKNAGTLTEYNAEYFRFFKNRRDTDKDKNQNLDMLFYNGAKEWEHKV